MSYTYQFEANTQLGYYVTDDIMISGYSAYDNSNDVLNENQITASDPNSADSYGISVAVGSNRIVVGSYLDDDNGSDSGSAYVYDLNGNEIVKLTALDGASTDYYGYSVAVGCGRIVVGAYGVAVSNQSEAGAAYIYDLNGNFIKKITAYDFTSSDRFGWSVTVGSGRIVIGAYLDDDKGVNSGSAYIYDLNGTLITKLTAFDGAGFDQFGSSVSVGSGRIVIGAHRDDDNGSDSGSAYVYDLNGNLITKLTAYDGASEDSYGYSVSVSSGRIVVGSPNDGSGMAFGAVYIYDLNGNLVKKSTASDIIGGARYGESVSVGSGRIVIGTVTDERGSASGSAYVCDLNGNELVKLIGVNVSSGDSYGKSVSVGSGRIVIGSPFDDDEGVNSGSAYIYQIKNQIHMLDLIDEIYPY
jgi:hypothetical protein